MTTREMAHKLQDATEDDEPVTAEEEAAVREAEEDFAAGRTVSHEEMLRKYA